jgi:hypothetical protein
LRLDRPGRIDAPDYRRRGMKQVLAVGVAALLIAGALFLRAVLDDDSDASDGGNGRDLVVACVRELREACEALDGVSDLRIEDPAATIASAVAGEIDAWVTFDPWPEIATAQERRDVLGGEPVAVATTMLYLLARTDALPVSCNGEAEWACVADAAGSAGPALPLPDSALGALALGHAAAGWNHSVRDNAPFAANEFALPEFEDWLRRLTFVRDPVLDALQLGNAGPVAVTMTGAELATIVQPSPRAEPFDRSPTPVTALVAVVVAGPGAAGLADQESFREALDALGYDRADDPAVRTTGLPAPGVLLALQELA